MAFKLLTVLCATLAFAHGGYLAPAAYSSAPAVSHVYSSIGSPVLAHGKCFYFYSDRIFNFVYSGNDFSQN